jgi:hypothetical protein
MHKISPHVPLGFMERLPLYLQVLGALLMLVMPIVTVGWFVFSAGPGFPKEMLLFMAVFFVLPSVALFWALFPKSYRNAVCREKAVASGRLVAKHIEGGRWSWLDDRIFDPLKYRYELEGTVYTLERIPFLQARVGDEVEVHFLPDTGYVLRVVPTLPVVPGASGPTGIFPPAKNARMAELESAERELLRGRLVKALLLRTLLAGSALLGLLFLMALETGCLYLGETTEWTLPTGEGWLPFLLLGLPALIGYGWINWHTLRLYLDIQSGQKKVQEMTLLDVVTSNRKIGRWTRSATYESGKWTRREFAYRASGSLGDFAFVDTGEHWIEVPPEWPRTATTGQTVLVRLAARSGSVLGVGERPA